MTMALIPLAASAAPLVAAPAHAPLAIFEDFNWDVILRWLVGQPLFVALTIVITFGIQTLVLFLLNRIIRRFAKRARTERPGQAKRAARTAELTSILMSERREQRTEAIGQLLRSIVVFVLWSVAILVILSEFRVDIAPLVASAGVIGVALGFGAQTLIKDFLSGIGLILEDQYGVGDIVDVGPVVGTVEEVNLRVTKLRDFNGVVWYVRNGEILRVANRSQGWTLAVVDIPVAYNEDLDKVRSIIERVSEDMHDDQKYDDVLLSPPTYAGVDSVSGDAVVVKITAKVAPQQQIAGTRAIRERVKLAFDRAGIHVPTLVRPVVGAPGTVGVVNQQLKPPPDPSVPDTAGFMDPAD